MQNTSVLLRTGYFLVGIFLSLGTWLATVALISYDPVPAGIDIASGSKMFHDNCEACHYLVKGVRGHHGPNFFDFGKVAGTRKPGLSAAEYILESILEPKAFVGPQNRNGMPKSVAHDLSADEIRNIVAFLAGRGARPDYEEILRLKIPEQPAPSVRTVRLQDMELAEQALRERGECLRRHSLHRDAEHQVFAPVLFGAGLVDEQEVRESIVDPSKVLSAAHADVRVVLESGQFVSGRMILQTDDRVVLLASDEQNNPYRLEIAASEIEKEDGQPIIQQSETSPMPTNFDQLLTPDELEAVIRLIRQLN